jgi:uncharacterized cupin superfamily protein
MSCRVVRAASAPLTASPLDPAQVVAGDPVVGTLTVVAEGPFEVGVWEHTTGVSTDVESDEVFVVLSGRATVEVEDGPALELAPGDIGVLEAGARTTWRVHETLRKVYVVAR